MPELNNNSVSNTSWLDLMVPDISSPEPSSPLQLSPGGGGVMADPTTSYKHTLMEVTNTLYQSRDNKPTVITVLPSTFHKPFSLKPQEGAL